MKSEVTCLICGKCNVDNFKVSSDVSISVCREDGLVFMNPRWSKEKYSEYYRDSYKESANAIVLKPHSPPCNKMWSLISRNDLNKVKNVLDIGAASGSLLERIRLEMQEVNLHGIEPFEKHAESMQERGVKVVALEAEEKWNNVPVEGFDLVTMRHVLEHFLDPLSILQKIRNFLVEGGIICLEVPNCQAPLGRADQYFILPHTYYFSIHTLKYLATRAGFKAVHCYVPEDNKHVIQATLRKSKGIDLYSIPNEWSVEQLEIVKKVPGIKNA